MKTQLRNPWFNFKLVAVLGSVSLLPALAQAHPLPGQANGFASGLNHPLHGLDHILAMVAVGLWAAQLGGRALWLVPATFISLMTVGGMLGMTAVPVPGVEAGILVSVLVLGLLVASAARLPLAASMALAGLFAIFHGHAHGTELPAAASGLSYGLGFVLASVGLHACGMGVGLLAQKRFTVPAIRFAGGAIALGGLCLWLA
ncbi:MAG: hydrogenase/urease accessory protein [Pedosphaera sp.]|nr:hydrogenase/urease accessory protein [Pedosphaera sp.]